MTTNRVVTHVERWNELFTRRETLRYPAEDIHLLQAQQKGVLDKTKLIARILKEKSSPLDPPEKFKYPALRRFLAHVDKTRLKRPFLGGLANEIVLLDERNDTLMDGIKPKPWDMDGDPGYLWYPEPGDSKTSRAMKLEELFEILSMPVSRIKMWINSHSYPTIERERSVMWTDEQCERSMYSGLIFSLTYQFCAKFVTRLCTGTCSNCSKEEHIVISFVFGTPLANAVTP
jgi:hypothetical protein